MDLKNNQNGLEKKWKLGISPRLDKQSKFTGTTDIYWYSPAPECLKHRSMTELIYFNKDTNFERIFRGNVPRKKRSVVNIQWETRGEWWEVYGSKSRNLETRRKNALEAEASGVRKFLIDSNGEFQGLILPKRHIDFKSIKDAVKELQDYEQVERILSSVEGKVGQTETSTKPSKRRSEKSRATPILKIKLTKTKPSKRSSEKYRATSNAPNKNRNNKKRKANGNDNKSIKPAKHAKTSDKLSEKIIFDEDQLNKIIKNIVAKKPQNTETEK